jgi:hypothetical protein
MRIGVKLKVISDDSFQGEIFIKDRIFMYSLNYPEGIEAVKHRKDYFKLELKDEDGRNVNATENVLYHLSGMLGLFTCQLDMLPNDMGVIPYEIFEEFNDCFLESDVRRDLEDLIGG